MGSPARHQHKPTDLGQFQLDLFADRRRGAGLRLVGGTVTVVFVEEPVSEPAGDVFDRDVPFGTMQIGGAYPEGFEPFTTVDEIMVLQDRFLEVQLTTLVDNRASRASQEDVFDWLMEPLVPQAIAGAAAPLSYQRCCYARGCDPADLREAVLDQLDLEQFVES